VASRSPSISPACQFHEISLVDSKVFRGPHRQCRDLASIFSFLNESRLIVWLEMLCAQWRSDQDCKIYMQYISAKACWNSTGNNFFHIVFLNFLLPSLYIFCTSISFPLYCCISFPLLLQPSLLSPSHISVLPHPSFSSNITSRCTRPIIWICHLSFLKVTSQSHIKYDYALTL
jgi:hypothetical protein